MANNNKNINICILVMNVLFLCILGVLMKKILYCLSYFISAIFLGCLVCHSLGIFPFFSPILPEIKNIQTNTQPTTSIKEVQHNRKLLKVETINAPKGEIYIAHYEQGYINTYFKQSDVLEQITHKQYIKVANDKNNAIPKIPKSYLVAMVLLFALSVFFRNKMDVFIQKDNV